MGTGLALGAEVPSGNLRALTFEAIDTADFRMRERQEPRLKGPFISPVVPASCRRYGGTSIFGHLAWDHTTFWFSAAATLRFFCVGRIRIFIAVD